MKTVGVVACSDAQKSEWSEQNQNLISILESTGRNVLVSNCIYEKNGPFSGTGKERAKELMKFFLIQMSKISMISLAVIWKMNC